VFFFLSLLLVIELFAGRAFLEAGVGPLNGFAVFIATCSFIFLSNIYDCIKILRNNLWLVVFCAVGFVSILFSFLGLYHLFFGIPTDRAYVIRQAYFFPMLLLFIPVFTLAWRQNFLRYFEPGMFSAHAIVFGGGVIAVLIIGYYNLAGNILLLVPALFISRRSKIASIVLLVIWYLLSYQGLVNMLILITALAYVVTQVALTRKTVVIAGAVGVLIMMSLGTANILRLQKIDPNSAWRFYAWTKNIQYSVLNTYAAGVGYGTPYFLGTKFDLAYVLLSGREGSSVEDSGQQEAMVRGQHNSLVNIFYRLGIVGTILFLQFVFSLYRKMGRADMDPLYGFVFFFMIIDISTNVGLESPATLIQFVLIVAFLIKSIEDSVAASALPAQVSPEITE